MGAGEEIERGGESRQAVDLLAEGIERRRVRRQDAVAERLEVALQVRERGPQLVRGVDDELAPNGILFGEPVDHHVEGVGQRPHLRGSVDRRRGAQVTLGRPLGRLREALDRPRDSASKDRPERQRHHGCHDRGDQEDAGDAGSEHRARVLCGLPGSRHQIGERLGTDAHDPESQHEQHDEHHREGRDDNPRRDPVRPHRELHAAPPAAGRRSTRPAAR